MEKKKGFWAAGPWQAMVQRRERATGRQLLPRLRQQQEDVKAGNGVGGEALAIGVGVRL